MSPDTALLNEMVRRIVESVHPQQISLFGSAARGEMGPDSDLDVLVVMPDGCDRLEVTQTLHCRLSDLEIAKLPSPPPPSSPLSPPSLLISSSFKPATSNGMAGTLI